MIPKFTEEGFLPKGIYKATIEEVKTSFGISNPKRKKLFNGLLRALNNLKSSGIKKVYIDGSFISSKTSPNDIDGCWEIPKNLDRQILDPVFQDFSYERKAMKQKYSVEFFPATWIEGDSGYPFVLFFQLNRDGKEKGIILIEL